MIQRIQTLYLLAAVVLHILIYFFPLWHGQAMDAAGPYSEIISYASKTVATSPMNVAGQTGASHIENGSGINMAAMILNGLIVFGMLGAVFLFRQRMNQVKLIRMMMFLVCIVIGLLFYAAEQAKTMFGVQPHSSTYGAGVYFPVISLLLLFLATRAIMADERLVRSADRLR